MARLSDIQSHSRWTDMFEGQLQQLAIAAFMTLGVLTLLPDAPDAPHLLGPTAHGWALLSIGLAIAHQIIVALLWRLQLFRAALTRLFGAHDMRIFAVIFLPLLAARPLTILLAGLADTTPILPGARWAEWAIGLALLLPAIWGMHSTLVYFTLPRALGGDHFRDEIAALPPVTKGAFGYSSNAMYSITFLGLWSIAFLTGSLTALILAAFQHAFIWVHFYCTEQPDMARIYGAKP